MCAANTVDSSLLNYYLQLQAVMDPPKALMPEGMLDVSLPTPVLSGVALGTVAAVGSVPVTFLYKCIQWKGNWEGSNLEKIVQVKKQVGVLLILYVHRK